MPFADLCRDSVISALESVESIELIVGQNQLDRILNQCPELCPWQYAKLIAKIFVTAFQGVDAIEESLVRIQIRSPHAIELAASTAVVCRDHHHGIRVVAGVLEGDGDALIKRQLIMNDGAGVIAVPRMIDTTRFDLKKETVGLAIENLQGGTHHFSKSRNRLCDLLIVLTVESVGQVCFPEGSEETFRNVGGTQ